MTFFKKRPISIFSYDKYITLICASWFAGASIASSATLLESFSFTGGSTSSSVGGSTASYDNLVYGTTTTGVDGDANGAYSFNGSGQYLRSDRDVFDIPTSGQAAVSGWFKTSVSDSTRRYIVSMEDEYVLEYEDGEFRAYFDGSAGFDSYGAGYNDGQWHHFVMQHTSSGYTELYLDGVIVASFIDGYDTLSSVSKRYSVASNHRGNSNQFIGSVDEIKLYDGALTLSEIRALAGVTSVPPVAVNDSYLIVENTTRVIAAPGVTENDYDEDGHSFTAAVVTTTTNGSLSLNSDGSFTYTPNTDFIGQDSFTYELTDTESEVSAVATVTLDVVDANTVLSAAEISQIETALGVTLSEADQLDLASIVKPQTVEQWRTDAEARIEANRKADLTIEVVDSNGLPVDSATVQITQSKNEFNFSGSLRPDQVFDLGGGNDLTGSFTPEQWKDRAKELFNAVGTNNALKPRLDQLYDASDVVPSFSAWAEANDLGLRGHLCIWPGTADMSDVDALDFDPSNPSDPNFDQSVYDTLMNHLSPLVREKVADFISVYQANGKDLSSAALDAPRLALKDAAALEVSNWVSNAPGGVYAGQTTYAEGWNVYEWDVINETNTNTLLMELLDDPDTASVDEGLAEMANWFNLADSNQINSDALLMLNEYQIISAKSSNLVPDSNGTSYLSRSTVNQSRLDRIIADGGALTGLGFQSRFKFEHMDPATIYTRLQEYGNKYNLPMSGTEFEILNGGRQDDGSNLNFTDYERAQMTEEILTTYFSHPLVVGLTAWSYVGDIVNEPKFMLGFDGEVGLNAIAWYYLHRIRYATNSDGSDTTDTSGQTTIRGFKGEYDITVSYGGSDYPATAILDGDKVVQVVLNDVSQVILDPVPQGYLLEQWLFEEDLDVQFPGLANSVGGASFSGGAEYAVTDGEGRLVFETGDSLYRNASLTGDARTSGRYEMLFQSQDVDFSTAEQSAQNVGFGFRDSSLSADIVLIRLSKVSASIRLEARIDGATTVLHNFGTDAVAQPINVRTIVDLDKDLAYIYYALGNTDEVLAGSVSLSATANSWDQIRMVATTGNFGATDFARIGYLSYSELLPDYADTDVIEEWLFEDSSGLEMSAVANTAGIAVFSGATPTALTDGAGGLVVTQGPSLFRNAGNLGIGSRDSGVYEMEFRLSSIDLSNSANGANVGFGLRDGTVETSSLRDIYLVRVISQSGTLRLQSRIDNVNTTLHNFGAASLTDLVVRVVVDLDQDTASVYYNLGGAGEVSVGENLAVGASATHLNEIRFVAQSADTAWGATDTAVVDYLLVRKHLGSYAAWSEAQTWGLELLKRPDDDPDGDGFSNFAEYVLGGDPVLLTPVTQWPRLNLVGGVPYLEFELGADPFDVIYEVQHSIDLVDWTTLPTTKVTSGSVGDMIAVDISDEVDTFFSRLVITPKLK